MAKEPDKIVWKATSLAAFTRSHRGSLTVILLVLPFLWQQWETTNYFFPRFEWLGKSCETTKRCTIESTGLHHLTFGIPLKWSTRQENGSRTLDKKDCQVLFYSPGEWGTTNRSIPPSKQLWITSPKHAGHPQLYWGLSMAMRPVLLFCLTLALRKRPFLQIP